MQQFGYQELIDERKLSNLEGVLNFFKEDLSSYWVQLYKSESNNYYGDITIQNYLRYTFIYDFTGDPITQGIEGCSIPDSRVVGVFGITDNQINHENRRLMKGFLGAAGSYDCLGGKYDRGHFIANLSGGPIAINLYPQRRDVNRGWSAEGKRYREMEKYIAAHPGIFVFSRPIYNDFSCRPNSVIFGYCTTDMKVIVEEFPNKYN